MTDFGGSAPGTPDGGPGATRADPLQQDADRLLADDPDADDPDALGLGITSPSSGVLVVTVTGELDMLTAPQLRHEVTRRIPDSSLVVLALDGVRFLGTSGLAALIELREQAHREGVELRLACTERRVLRPIGIAGLHHLFDIHDDVEASLNS